MAACTHKAFVIVRFIPRSILIVCPQLRFQNSVAILVACIAASLIVFYHQHLTLVSTIMAFGLMIELTSTHLIFNLLLANDACLRKV